MSSVRERFNPVLMGANSSYRIDGPHMGGFLAKTSGTITVAGRDALGTSAATFVDAIPVTAGIYTPIPLIFPAPGAQVTLGGGASGTLLV